MAGGGSSQSSGGGNSSGGAFSWGSGGGTNPSGGVFNPNTSTFDAKGFGTKIFSDLNTAYGKGPQSVIPSYNPYTAQTSGLIQQGLDQTSANAGGPLADFASGKNLGAGNPYLQHIIDQTNNDTGTAVNSAFNSSGLYGSDVHAKGLAEGIGNADNNLRYADYQQGFNNMLGAQGALAQNTANGLGYSGLLDSKNAEQIASNREQQAATDPYNYLAKYIGLLNSGQPQQNSNQPLGIGDILGGVLKGIGSFL